VERNTGLNFADLTQAQIDAAMCRQFTTYNAPVCFDLTIPTRAYHSVSITREIGENLRITAGISNVLDSRPPRVSDVGGDGINTLGQGVLYSQYDLFGRRGFVNINLRY
jgi:iron complex outermembrane receptor protein